MKGFFLTVIGILLSIALVRFGFGFDSSNQFSYLMQTVLELPPNIKDDFNVVISACDTLMESIRVLREVSTSGGSILEVLQSFLDTFGALLNVPFAFVEFLLLIVGQLLNVLKVIFELLFLPAKSPIVV